MAELRSGHGLLLLGGVVFAVLLEITVRGRGRDLPGDVVLQETVELLDFVLESQVSLFSEEKLRHCSLAI